MLHNHASLPCFTAMLHNHASQPCYTTMLHIHALQPCFTAIFFTTICFTTICFTTMLHKHASQCLTTAMLHNPALNHASQPCITMPNNSNASQPTAMRCTIMLHSFASQSSYTQLCFLIISVSYASPTWMLHNYCTLHNLMFHRVNDIFLSDLGLYIVVICYINERIGSNSFEDMYIFLLRSIVRILCII